MRTVAGLLDDLTAIREAMDRLVEDVIESDLELIQDPKMREINDSIRTMFYQNQKTAAVEFASQASRMIADLHLAQTMAMKAGLVKVGDG